MDRRKFWQSLGWGAAGLTTYSCVNWSQDDASSSKKLTILHTNDTHSHIDPFPDDDADYPGRGGVMRRAELIKTIRSQEDHVLLLDAGDVFQGTPYFNMYGGELEMKLMQSMRYDAATMGNHDFDAGIDGFNRTLPYVDFPFICSNYDFSNTPLADQTKEYEIFQKGSVKIGIIGLGIELEGLVSPSNFENTKYLDPLEKAEKLSKMLKEDLRCDLVICLSHLGYEYENDKISDRVIAQNTSGIDLIIGGHTHTFLNEPQVLKNKINKDVLVNQVGWAGLNLGRIDFILEPKDQGGYRTAETKSKSLKVL